MPEPKHPGTTFKAIGQDGYDDGGVADLTLVIDLEDTVLRRKRGENNYFTALKADLLPRVTTGQLQGITRREQKIRLAKLLFDEDDKGDEDANPSEVYMEPIEDGVEDAAAVERLRAAKFALKLSSVLREPACASLSLSEISKRYLNSYGKEQAEAALRCADKAIEISSNGFYDSDSIAIEVSVGNAGIFFSFISQILCDRLRKNLRLIQSTRKMRRTRACPIPRHSNYKLSVSPLCACDQLVFIEETPSPL